MKDCKCHWEGSVFYADSECIVDPDNPRYTGGNIKHDIPPSVPDWRVEFDTVSEYVTK